MLRLKPPVTSSAVLRYLMEIDTEEQTGSDTHRRSTAASLAATCTANHLNHRGAPRDSAGPGPYALSRFTKLIFLE